jgi:predicted ester cyclase
MVRSVCRDVHVRIEDQVAEGDLVATRYVVSGTQEGEMGVSLPRATGRSSRG